MKTVVMILAKDFLYPFLDARVFKEAKVLVKEGKYKVSVICWAKRLKKTVPKYFDYQGIKIIRIFPKLPSPSSHFLRKAVAYVRYLIPTLMEIKRLKPDIIHSHDLDALPIGVVSKILIGGTLIYDAHEDWPAMIQEKKIVKYFVKNLERILVKYVDHVVTVNETLAKKFKKFKCPVTIIYNASELEDFKPDPKSFFTLRKKLKISPKDKIILFHGGISKERGIDKLVIAMNYLNNPRIKCLIVGNGPYLKHVKRMAKKKNRCLFTGAVPYEDIPKYVGLSDVGVVLFQPTPNNVIATPHKLFDYLAGGLPVIVSEFPEMKKIIEENNCGIAVDPTSPEEIAKTIRYLVCNDRIRKKMTKNAIIVAREKYNWKKMGETLKKLYKRYV